MCLIGPIVGVVVMDSGEHTADLSSKREADSARPTHTTIERVKDLSGPH